MMNIKAGVIGIVGYIIIIFGVASAQVPEPREQQAIAQAIAIQREENANNAAIWRAKAELLARDLADAKREIDELKKKTEVKK